MMIDQPFAVVRYTENGAVRYGCISGNDVLGIEGDVFGEFKVTQPVALISEVKILPPCTPTKVVAVGHNYESRVAELGIPAPAEPLLFLKPPSAVIGSCDNIVYPAMSHEIRVGGELGIVMAHRTTHVTEHEARGCILGYTCCNDVTASDLLGRDATPTRAKSFDTFCPVGPCISLGLDPMGLRMQTRIDGKLVQDCSTGDMVFTVYQIVSFVSQVMTLEPGDILLTGTPPGTTIVERGNVAEVEIEGIGILRNAIV